MIVIQEAKHLLIMAPIIMKMEIKIRMRF